MNANKEKLTNYYNKFNEDKRLKTRHGQVEFITTTHFIDKYLKSNDSILDVGAGSGAYSVYYKNKNHEVTAIEYTRPNIGKIKAKDKTLKVIEASATDLRMLDDQSYDIVLLLGPMYHLYSKNDRIKALKEAKRIARKYIFVAYYMADYAIIKHGFIDNYYLSVKDVIDDDYNINDPDNLFFFSRIEEMDELNKIVNLKLKERFTSDGPTDYIRNKLNKMDEKTFKAFIDYQIKTCTNKYTLGAGSHVVDILEK